jgi:4-amino-4-deoxy-L-arabinose transferase-like glycosyltransferase
MDLHFWRSELRRPVKSAESFPEADARLYARLFWTWLILRTLVWTTAAYLTALNPPLDVAEMLAWGRDLAWGYSKHPPLPAWIAEGALFLFGGSIWGVYFASYAVIAVCFWAAWRLGRELLSPRQALFAALALEGLVYFHFDAFEFNHNVMLAASWALTVLCFFRALRGGSNRAWLALGVCMGLGMLSKYSVGFLFLAMLLYLIFHPAVRVWWKRPGPYLAGAVAFLIFLPHAFWCLGHNLGPINHMLHKAKVDEHTWWHHVRYPGYFLFSQLLRLLPLLLILAPLTGWRWRFRKLAPDQRFGRDFLLAIGLGPALLHVLFSLIGGIELRDQWGFQLWTFAGVAVLFFVEVRPAEEKLIQARRLAVVFTTLFLVAMVTRNLLGPSLGARPTRVHFPGRPLAEQVERTWRQNYRQPIPIVASRNGFMGDSVSWYLPGRPLVFLPDSLEETPGVADRDLNTKGGIILWNVVEGEDLPKSFQGRFPTARNLEPVSVPYHAGWRLPPLKVGIALVPPSSEKAGTASTSPVKICHH